MKNFCWHLARSGKPAEAAKAAGYAGEQPTLNSQALRLLRNPKIREEVKRQRQHYLASIGADKDRLISEALARAGITVDGETFTPHDFIERTREEKVRFTKNGDAFEYAVNKWSLIPKERLPRRALRMVKAIKISYSPNGDENIALEFFDQIKAIELVARISGLLKDDKDAGKSDVQETAEKIRDALLQMEKLGGEESGYEEPRAPQAEDASGGAPN